jgi:ComF family protein
MDWSTRSRFIANSWLFFNQALKQTSICIYCLASAPEEGIICNECRDSLPKQELCCAQCSEPTTQPGRCGKCQQHPPSYHYSHCNFHYQAPLSDWIRNCKDQRNGFWLKYFARWMIDNPPNSLDSIDALVYIPSDRWRLARRSFNVSELIARKLSREFDIPIIEGCLHKKYGKDQRGLSAQQRRTQLKSRLLAGSQNLTNKHVVIIDDVMTTGATADLAATHLLHQGARLVGVWCLARTLPKINNSD